jgi:hypothetical protein
VKRHHRARARSHPTGFLDPVSWLPAAVCGGPGLPPSCPQRRTRAARRDCSTDGCGHSITRDRPQPAIWGSRGREFKSRQPDQTIHSIRPSRTGIQPTFLPPSMTPSGGRSGPMAHSGFLPQRPGARAPDQASCRQPRWLLPWAAVQCGPGYRYRVVAHGRIEHGARPCTRCGSRTQPARGLSRPMLTGRSHSKHRFPDKRRRPLAGAHSFTGDTAAMDWSRASRGASAWLHRS